MTDYSDPEPQPEDGPDYHANMQAWLDHRADIQSRPLPVGGEEFRHEFDVAGRHISDLPGARFNLNPVPEGLELGELSEDLATEETPPFELAEPPLDGLQEDGSLRIGGFHFPVDVSSMIEDYIQTRIGEFQNKDRDVESISEASIGWSDFHAREVALAEATKTASLSGNPYLTVLRAEAYLSFLMGQSRELIDAEIRKAFKRRGLDYDEL